MAEQLTYTFTENTTIEWEGRRIAIQKMIGSGLFTDVYKGILNDQTDVAIKVFKVGKSVEMRDRFSGEMGNLNRVWQCWENRYQDQPHPTPCYHGGQDRFTPPFFMMEFIRGESFESLLKNGQTFSEAEALGLMRQLGQLLVVLHEDMGQYYADMKFENFWVVPQAESPALLKVIDWNVLGTLDQEGATRDLFYASLYLYGLLTGSMLDYTGVSLRSRLSDDPGFEKLTHGMQTFLHLSLHPNPARRYQTAREWTNAITELEKWWINPEQDLLKEAAKTLREAQENHKLGETLSRDGQKARESGDEAQSSIFYQDSTAKLAAAAERYDRAKQLYDIAERRQVKFDPQVWRQRVEIVTKGLQTTSYLERGRELLEAGFFSSAIDMFDIGAELSLVAPESLRRWGWIARAANAVGLSGYEQVKARAAEGVEALIAENYQQAQNCFEMVLRYFELPPLGIKVLHEEAQIYNLAHEAARLVSDQKYAEAIQKYENAFNLWKDLPTEPPTHWAESAGDLNRLLQDAKNQLMTIDAVNDLCLQISQDRLSKRWDQMAQHYAELYRIAPNHLPKGADGWMDAVQKALGEGNLEAAEILAEKAVLSPTMKQTARPVWNWITGLLDLKERILPETEAETKEKTVSRLKALTDRAGRYYATHRAEPGFTAAAGRLYTKILKSAVSQALNVDDFEQAGTLVNLIESLDLPDTQKQDLLSIYTPRLLEHRRKHAVELFEQACRLHRQNTFETSRQAGEYLVEMESLLPQDDAQWGKWRSLINEIKARLDFFRKEDEGKQQRNARRVEALWSRLSKLEQERAENLAAQAGLNPDSTRDASLRQVLAIEAARQLAQIGWILSQLNDLQPADPQIGLKISEYKDETAAAGADYWEVLRDEANIHLSPVEIHLKNAVQAYQAGHVDQTKELLEKHPEAARLAEGKALADRIRQTEKFLSWAKNDLPQTDQKDSALLWRILDAWREQDFPEVYWKEGGVQPVLERCSKVLVHALAGSRMDGQLFHQAARAIEFRMRYRDFCAQPARTGSASLADVLEELERVSKKDSPGDGESAARFLALVDQWDAKNSPSAQDLESGWKALQQQREIQAQEALHAARDYTSTRRDSSGPHEQRRERSVQWWAVLAASVVVLILVAGAFFAGRNFDLIQAKLPFGTSRSETLVPQPTSTLPENAQDPQTPDVQLSPAPAVEGSPSAEPNTFAPGLSLQPVAFDGAGCLSGNDPA